MALQPYEIVLNDKTEGVVIVDTCTGIPLRIRRSAFNDIDDANEFLGWAYCAGCLELATRDVEGLITEWDGLRGASPCPWCDSKNRLSLHRRSLRVSHGGGWSVCCLCGDFRDDGGDYVFGVGASVEDSISAWNDIVRGEAARMECA